MSRITVATLFAALVAACGPDTNTPFEEARRALKAQKPAEAVPHLEKVLAAAQSMPPGGPRAELQAQAGRLLWSAQRTDLAEAALLDAAKQIEAAPASVSAKTSEETYRFLGVIYRDARRPQDATPWFERAVAANRRMPDSPNLEKRVKQLSLASNLQALADAQCAAGDAARAEATDKERTPVCAEMDNPGSVAACIYAPRPCERGRMQVGQRQF